MLSKKKKINSRIGPLATAVTTLVGTIVGAGILGIPYVIAKAGFLYGCILIALIGVGFIFLNLFMGEVVLRTKKQHQLPGYAELYLGPWGKRLMTFSMLIAIYGALTAYLIGEGATLFSLFGFANPLFFTILFFTITFLIIYKGVKATGKAELILISLLMFIIVLISFISFDDISVENFSTFNPAFFLLPYGVILFAFLGSPAIPEIQEILGKNKKLMKKAIIIGSILPIVIYIIFSIVIGGLIGLENFELLEPNERIATVALSFYSHPLLGALANVLAALAMFTSFLTLGLALIQTYKYDYGFSNNTALLLTFSLPLIIASFNLTTFLAVLGATGAFAGGIEGIIIILMFWKAKLVGKRKPEYTMSRFTVLGWLIMLVFFFGILQQVWRQFF